MSLTRFGNEVRDPFTATFDQRPLARFSFLGCAEAKLRGDDDGAFKWRKALEEPTRESKWTLLKNLVKNFDLMLDSENGDGKRDEYSRALQNLVDSF